MKHDQWEHDSVADAVSDAREEMKRLIAIAEIGNMRGAKVDIDILSRGNDVIDRAERRWKTEDVTLATVVKPLRDYTAELRKIRWHAEDLFTSGEN